MQHVTARASNQFSQMETIVGIRSVNNVASSKLFNNTSNSMGAILNMTLIASAFSHAYHMVLQRGFPFNFAYLSRLLSVAHKARVCYII